MPERRDLESAILDAEGAVALLFAVQEGLLTAPEPGPARLGIDRPEGLYVYVLNDEEQKALCRAINLVGTDVAAISQAFYGERRRGCRPRGA